MDYLEYYKRVNAKKQIKKLSKKYKNKRIVVYGAGIMASLLFENYDVSGLNIVGVCDRKFNEKEEKFFNYDGIGIKKLKEIDYDVILILVLREISVMKSLRDGTLVNTKNENVKIEPFIKIPFLQCLLALLG